ncbi:MULTISPECIES: FHA domain-containing protein [Fusobacterium]|uniref:FHA domain-containing protein n=1 Tax=Fusobacterium TaxID=848 RepID=UPI0010301189|nr:FHA domain-containing protein [Fusobacterium ulcerans]
MRFLKNWKLRREIKKYQKKEMRKSEIKERKVNYIFWGIVLIASFALVYYFHFSKEILIIISMMIMGFVIADLFYYSWKLKRDLIMYEKSQFVRDSRIVKSIEDKREQSRNNITHVILKNEEGYDIKTWPVGKANSLIIGKSARMRVDINLGETAYSSLISKRHAILNKTDNGWFVEDLGSVNGTGIQRYADNRKIKIGNAPVKIQSGDIIYISTVALLVK